MKENREAAVPAIELSERRVVTVGERVVLRLPYSEVCMHMHIAGRKMLCEVRADGVQVFEYGNTPQERPFSFPITHGEAGVLRDGLGALFTDVYGLVK